MASRCRQRADGVKMNSRFSLLKIFANAKAWALDPFQIVANSQILLNGKTSRLQEVAAGDAVSVIAHHTKNVVKVPIIRKGILAEF